MQPCTERSLRIRGASHESSRRLTHPRESTRRRESRTSINRGARFGCRRQPQLRDNVVAFTALPNSVRLVLLLVFLNSFRSFGLRFVQQLYLTNEFGLDDLEAASVLGTSASLHVAFGLIGAVLTDAIGVRRVALTALSIFVVGRGLLAFGRDRASIYAAFYLFSPAGEALLATGLYRVALKKLTTPKTRAFAFAVEYATFNLSGALADVCIDAFRRRDVTLGDQTMTPTRQFLVLTFVVVCASWLLVALHLRDESVVEADDGSPVASAPPPQDWSLTSLASLADPRSRAQAASPRRREPRRRPPLGQVERRDIHITNERDLARRGDVAGCLWRGEAVDRGRPASATIPRATIMAREEGSS